MQFIPMNYTFIKIRYPQLGSFKYLYDPFVGSGQTFLNFLDKDINRKRVLTYCKTCDKQMELQDDINTDKENMKIYACPSCGKVRRVIYKKRR